MAQTTGQAARPASMASFDRLSERFLADVETVKEAGGLVAGIYCTFAPAELVRAAGAVPVGLCGKKQKPIPDAEKTLPANLCPLIKSSYGYAVTDTCPYFSAADLLIGETTCDGKKKMFELLGRIKPLHLMHLPCSGGEEQLAYWLGEVRRLGRFLSERTGRTITDDALRREIRVQNEVRRMLREVAGYAAKDAIPLSGLDLMTVMEAKSFVVDQESYLEDLRRLSAELAAMAARGQSVRAANAPRILLTGCPVGKGSEKVLRCIEEAGAVVVCQENCTGYKSFAHDTDESGDPWVELARRYLRTPCSCLTPNSGRFGLLGELCTAFRADGVVDLTWQCCHTYNVEAHAVREFVEGERGLPFLHLETDYSESDIEQLRTRIEAFLELV